MGIITLAGSIIAGVVSIAVAIITSRLNAKIQVAEGRAEAAEAKVSAAEQAIARLENRMTRMETALGDAIDYARVLRVDHPSPPPWPDSLIRYV